MSNNNVAVKDDRENIAKVVQANQPKTKFEDFHGHSNLVTL